MKHTLTNLLLIAFIAVLSTSEAQIVIKNDSSFNTMEQMLLANELFESGEPFAEELGYNLDNLNPMVLNSPDSMSYTMGIENYEYSRYLLGTVISRSGIGLHMMWAPMVERAAMMEPSGFDGSYTGGMANGFNEDDELMKMIHHFSMLSNQMAPANPFPQFAEFESADMRLPQTVAPNFQMDFSSLRFDRSKMNKNLNISAMGQTMLKQYFWAQDMLSAFHDSLDSGIDATGNNSPDSMNSPHFNPMNNIFYGGNNADGFIGQVLTAESINKTFYLLNNMAYDGDSLGMVSPATYNPANGIKYFPHKIAVTEKMMGTMMPPMVDTLIVSDASSHIFDQLSFLWATLSFKNMMDPSINDAAHYAFHEVFDGDPFPAPMSVTGMPGPFDLMMGASKVIFMNSMAMHFNMSEGTFVDMANLNSNKMVVMGNHISAFNAGYSLVVMAKMAEEFAGTPLDTMAQNALNAQTNFIITKLKNSSNGYYNSYTIGSGASSTPLTLESMSSIVRGLYASYSYTSNSSTFMEANNAYNYLINNFYIPSNKVFKTEINNMAVIEYTPLNLAALSGALREASITGSQANAAITYTRVFKEVYNGMILAEAEQSGESGNDSDGDGVPYVAGGNLPFVFAASANYSIISGIDNDNINKEIKFDVYPNPVSDIVNIEFELENSSETSINIYDITGNLIISKSINGSGMQKLKINVNELSPSIYFVRLMVSNEIKSIKRLVIVK